MSFDINTNVASLSAQNYLRSNSNFQNTTINRVTSGLRIVQSGDDAAGLAIANSYRSDEAVLTQGISNANDGLSQLQIMDGGMSNISQLLDRARTLATQSATGTFTGDRSVLNDEFQSVLGEINRQAQSIGLNTGGAFAKSLQVFVGGGKADATGSAASVIQNGSETLDLTHSTVDSQSLGLTGVTSVGTTGTDIGPNSGTSVSNILQNNANTGLQAGYSTFYFSGTGFSGANKIGVNVNLSGVTDANTLVAAINTAIGTAGAGSQYATAFKNTQITASLNTDANGKTQLTFSSGASAFQVQAGDTIANAFLGNLSSGSTGAALNTTVAGAAAVANPTAQNIVGTKLTAPVVITTGQNDTLNLAVSGVAGGVAQPLTLDNGSYNLSDLVNDINTKIQGSSLNGHVTASLNNSNQIVFQAASASDGSVSVGTSTGPTDGSDANGTLGLTNNQASLPTPTLTTNDTVTLQFQGGGLSAPVSFSLNQFQAGTTNMSQVLADLNTKIAGNKQLAAAGITATTSTQGNALVFTNAAGQRFDVEATGDSQNVLGLGTFLPNQTNSFNYDNLTAGAIYSASNASGTAATHASVTGTAALTDAYLNGLSGAGSDGLSIKIDGAQYNVDLHALNGAGSTTTLLGDINTALGVHGTASLNSSNQLVITSNSVGANASVQILGNATGDNASANLTLLGLPNAVAAATAATGANASAAASIGVSINGGANQVITASLNGSSTDATAAAATGAQINDTTIAGLASGLSLKIDGKQYDIASVAPATVTAFLNTVNTAINGSGPGTGTASINSAGHLVIKSNSLGTTGSVQILGNGVGDSTTADLTVLGLSAGTTNGQNASEANVMQQLNSAIAQNTTLTQAGLTATDPTNSGQITLSSTNQTNFRIDAYGAGNIGFSNSGQAFNGNVISSAPGSSQYFDAQGARATSTLAFAPVVFGGDQQSLSFAAVDANGTVHNTSVSLSASNAGSIDQALSSINNALQTTNDPTLQQVVAVKEDTNTGNVTGTALSGSTTITTGTNDSLNLTVGGTKATLVLTGGSYATPTTLAAQVQTQINSSLLSGKVTATVNSNNQIVLAAVNPSNTVEVNNVANDAATSLGVTDGQVSANEGIKFISNLNNFSVSLGQVGTTPGAEGVGSAGQQGTVIKGATVGAGSTADISNLASAQSAVSALANAVSTLGSAQAVVGRGENQFNYAVNLAQSQKTNFTTAESRIRDADLASEAANLTKAQILIQAGVAALAQANSAPQQVLSLLRG